MLSKNDALLRVDLLLSKLVAAKLLSEADRLSHKNVFIMVSALAYATITAAVASVKPNVDGAGAKADFMQVLSNVYDEILATKLTLDAEDAARDYAPDDDFNSGLKPDKDLH